MYIRAIALIASGRPPRVLRFHNGLNIVTGWSGTGKSSILDIVEYCLGRTRPSYPAGVLEWVVDWFAVELDINGGTVTVARPALAPGATSGTGAHLALGATIEEVAAGVLETNSDASTLRSELTRLLGISANEVRPPGPVRPALSASAGQALLLSFQAQWEIASKAHLFHRTDDRERHDALRAALPYFIGAVDVDTMALRQELELRQRELRRAEASVARLRLGAARFADGTLSLLAEAAVVGLVGGAALGMDQDAVVALLREVAESPSAADEAGDFMGGDTATGDLRSRQEQLIEVVSALEHRLAVLRGGESRRHDYGSELEEQLHRLQAIELLPANQNADEQRAECPLCGQAVGEDLGETAAVLHSLRELDSRIEGLRSAEPIAAEVRTELTFSLQAAREELHEVTAAIAAASRADHELLATRDIALQRAYLRGRIHEFVATAPDADGLLAVAETEVARLSAQVEGLRERLSPSNFRERTESMMRVISRDMTLWARQLRLEYSDLGVQIDPGALTVVADTQDGPVSLARMGSAAFIIGYHVTAHLALHKWFLERARPVPHFLILDQPSQAFYPDDLRRPEDELLSDEDRARVTELYSLLHEVTTSRDNRLQVIVLDHANLNETWFQGAVVANWRDGEALVPNSWLTDR